MMEHDKADRAYCETPLEEHLLEVLFDKDRFNHTGRLVRGLIHNINGPLQNVSMLVEMLIKGHTQMDRAACLGSEDFLREWSGVSEKQRQRMDRLTQQISVLAGMLQDFMVLQEIEQNESEVDVNLVLQKMASIFRADLFFKHQVQLELRLTDNLPLIPILGRCLVPSLMHIFGNALTALRTAPSKRLVIESRKKPGAVTIAFLNSGSGLDLTKSPDALFDLFHSEWPGSTLADGGEKHYGFGLFAVRRLLSPYGVKVSLGAEEDMTAAVLEIPVSC